MAVAIFLEGSLLRSRLVHQNSNATILDKNFAIHFNGTIHPTLVYCLKKRVGEKKKSVIPSTGAIRLV